MQEEVEHKTVNFAISTTKLTARTFLKGAQFLLRQYDKNASQGKQSMKRLIRQNRGVTNYLDLHFADPAPENMPLLEDLYNALLQQDEKEAHHVAAALEICVKGSLNVFNHRTNVDINNRIVCFDIKQLGKQLKKLGMLIVQDAVWGRVTANRSAGKSTRYYVDEFK